MRGRLAADRDSFAAINWRSVDMGVIAEGILAYASSHSSIKPMVPWSI